MRLPSVRACLPIIAVAALAGGAGAAWPARSADAPGPRPAPARSSVAPPARATIPTAAPAPAGLPVIDYWGAPRSFPADPAPASTAGVAQGLRPLGRRVVYDVPGGRPRAWLPRSISGLPVTVPIVERRPGWVAVLLPSINRRVGWLTTAGWTARPLRDQLVLRRRTHELTWFRDGARRSGWTVATGTATTPTPLGRTFVLGRTATSGSVYAGLDALALGSVPEDRASLPHALRTGHTGIHGWYSSGVFGRSISNGCIRVPGAGLRTLLRNLAPGTPLTVLDR